MPRLLQKIATTPFHYVDGKHFFVNQGAAKIESPVGMSQLHAEPLQQFFPDFLGNAARVRRVHIVVEHQVPQQHLPVLAQQVQKPAPIHLVTGAVDDVANIRSIKAFAPGHENLGSNEFLGRQYARRRPKNLGAAGALDPRSIHTHDRVAHPGNEIDEKARAPGFGQPDSIRYLCFKTCPSQQRQGSRNFERWKKQIEVFRVPPDAGVLMQRKSAAHGESYSASFKELDHLTEKSLLLWRE